MILASAGWIPLVAARILPCLLLVPAFGSRLLPKPAAVVLALILGTCVLEHLGPVGDCPSDLVWLGLLAKELCVGFVLAFAGTCLFSAARIGGALSDELRGAGRARSLVPWSGEGETPLAVLHGLLACALFFLADGPACFLRTLLASFQRLPITGSVPAGELGATADLAIGLVEQALDTGLWIALPVLGAVLISDTILGFLNRTAPQMQVYFLGMPVKASLGLLAAMVGLERALALLSDSAWWTL